MKFLSKIHELEIANVSKISKFIMAATRVKLQTSTSISDFKCEDEGSKVRQQLEMELDIECKWLKKISNATYLVLIF